MSATDVAESATESADESVDERSSHWYCCSEDVALCGVNLTRTKIDEDEPVTCVTCRALEDAPCEITCHLWLREAS